jgi:RimJ/RimL family protein N-acetyltransferase
MEFLFRPINEEDANVIISYKHGNDFQCFDSEKHASDIDTLLTMDGVDFFVAVNDDEDIIGFSEVTFDEDGIMEMSGALLPEFAGEGLGYDFLTQCIDYLIDQYDYDKPNIVTLVKPEDRRAIKVFERVGFQLVEEDEEWIQLSIDL